MKFVTRLAALLAAAASLPATAQNVCPVDPPPDCEGGSCKVACDAKGHPVHMISGRSTEAVRDLSIDTGNGTFELWRYFSSGPETSNSPASGGDGKWPEAAKAPFGRQPGLGVNGPPNPLWSHSLFSFVNTNFSTGPIVFNGRLGWLEFKWDKVSTASNFLQKTDYGQGTLERLQYFTNVGFVLVKKDGERWVYSNYGNPNGLWFLSAVRNRADRPLYTVSYADPAILFVNCGGNGNTGPYISYVTFPAGGKLEFAYGTYASQCVLTSISWRPDAVTAPTVVATYTYPAGSTQDGHIASGGGRGEIDAYLHPSSTSFSIVAPGGRTKVSHTYDPTALNKVMALNGAGDEPSFSVGSSPTPGTISTTVKTLMGWTAADPCGPTDHYLVSSSETVPLGSPTAGSGTMTSDYYSYQDTFSGGRHSTAFRARLDTCPATGSCSPGAFVQQRFGAVNAGSTCDASNPNVSLYTKNKRGNWSGTDRARHGTQYDDYYPVAHYRGRSSPTSSDHLEYVNQYIPSDPPPVYDANYVRRTDPIRRPSSIATAGFTHFRHEYDPTTGFRTKTLMSGWTRAFNGTYSYVTRGIFYKPQRICDASSADALNRVLRVEGPCETDNSSSPNGCSSASPYPVTEFKYYGNTGTEGLNTGRLESVRRYPGGSACGTALTTTYANYTAEGLPQTVSGEDGVVGTFEYEHGKRMTKRTVAGAITEYKYEADGELRWIKHPEGNYSVQCRYGTTSDTSCNTTVPANQKPRVQWTAKSANENGSAHSERANYEYAADGTLVKTTLLNAVNEVRSVSNIFPDAQGRATWTGTGSTTPGATSVVTRRSFDAADNVQAIGDSTFFGVAPDFCRSGGSLSPLCAWLSYDRAERLTALEQHPTGAADSTTRATCFDYDWQGNVRRVLKGCDSAASCSANSSASGAQAGAWVPRTTCSGQYPVDYEIDDFGDVVRVKFPWTSDTYPVETYYLYDARGNVIKKQTPQMRSLSKTTIYIYDQLGRLTQVNQDPTAPSFYLFYDANYGGGSCGSQTNVGGRLSVRWDSYGYTFYSYDAEGRVTKEARIKTGDSDCSNQNTNYTYSANGNLTQIVYPYGRTVSYEYGTGALKDRVAKVWAYHYLATPGLRQIINNVQWEPYGGLRGYEYLTGTAGTGGSGANPATVEYYMSGTSETPKTGTTCASHALDNTAPDGTGRTRALWVSSGSRAMGYSSGGDLLKQFYTWAGKDLANQQTCFTALTQTNEHRENFFNLRTGDLAIVTGSGMPVRTTGSGANTHLRTYAYDKRGNRKSGSIDGCNHVNVMNTYSAIDTLYWTHADSADPGCGGQWGGEAYLYDLDGNTAELQGGWGWWKAVFNYANGSLTGGTDSVYKTAVLTGGTGSGPGGTNGTYSYYYDAFNRRRFKSLPMGGSEQYFYDLGHQMLSNIGSDGLGSPSYWTLDDSIWLGGRQVAMFRGNISTTGVRGLDSVATCNRLGETGKCGLYHIINDYLPKPVLMVESFTEKVSHAALYDPFGHVNRIPLPTTISSGSGPMGTVSLPQGGTTDARARFLFADSPSAYLTLTGTIAWSSSPTTYSTKSRVWTPWVGQGSLTSVTAGTSGTVSANGVWTDFVEYRRYATGATPTWTQHRFPGQYHDPETDLFENWNRYYDPGVGRYLQPEPLLQVPDLALAMATGGRDAYTYSYAHNNPLNNTDPEGNAVQFLAAGLAIAIGEALVLTGVIGAGAYCIGTNCTGDASRWVRDQFRQSGPSTVKPITSTLTLPYVTAVPTGRTRNAQCHAACDKRTPEEAEEAMEELCNQLPQCGKPLDQMRRRLCEEAINAAGTSQTQKCHGLCDRAFGFSGP